MGFKTFQDEVREKFEREPDQVIAEALYQMHTPFKTMRWFRDQGIQTYDQTFRSWATARGWTRDEERGRGLNPPVDWTRTVAEDGTVTWDFPQVARQQRAKARQDDDWNKVHSLEPEDLFRPLFDAAKKK